MEVSVVILTRNDENHIRRCIESVIKQDYRNIEIIVVDADSMDRTIPIINEYATNEGRFLTLNEYKKPFRLIDVLRNTTIGEARQVGLEKSRGRIIAYIDSDVELPNKDWLNRMLGPFRNPKVGGAETIAKAKKSDHPALKLLHSSQKFKQKIIDIKHYQPIGTSHLLLRKSAIIKAGGFKPINYGEDTELTKKMMENGWVFVVMDKVFCYHYPVSSWKDYFKKKMKGKIHALRSKVLEKFISPTK